MIAQTKDDESAFAAASREWNERCGDSIRQAQKWRIAAIVSLAITTILAVVTIVLAG